MKLGRITGRVFCSRQTPNVDGRRLLLLQPLNWDTAQPEGDELVTADCGLDCGAGELVFFVQSREALVSFAAYEPPAQDASYAPPVDAAVVGIVDGYRVTDENGKIHDFGGQA